METHVVGFVFEEKEDYASGWGEEEVGQRSFDFEGEVEGCLEDVRSG